MHLRLGDLLVRQGVLTEEQRDAVLAEQRLVGRPFGALAERMFGVNPADVERAWAAQYAQMAEHVDPRSSEIDPYALRLVERRQAWQFRVLPLRFSGEDLVICTTETHLPRAMRFTGWRIGHPVRFVLAPPLQLGEALVAHYPIAGMPPDMVGAA